jgi:hypothetical protein
MRLNPNALVALSGWDKVVPPPQGNIRTSKRNPEESFQQRGTTDTSYASAYDVESAMCDFPAVVTLEIYQTLSHLLFHSRFQAF